MALPQLPKLFFFTFSVIVLPQLPIYIYIYIYIFFFFYIFGNGIATIVKTIFFFIFTFSAMPLPQLICHNFFELIIINHVWFIVKILWTRQLFFLLIHRFHNFFFYFRQWHCHNCQNKYIYIFFPISAMALSQLLFFNWPGSILGRGISVTVLSKFLFFLSPPFSLSLSSFLLNFGNSITEILFLFSV